MCSVANTAIDVLKAAAAEAAASLVEDGQVVGLGSGSTALLPFGWYPTAKKLQGLGARVTLRATAAGQPFVTDEDNYILVARSTPSTIPRGCKDSSTE